MKSLCLFIYICISIYPGFAYSEPIEPSPWMTRPWEIRYIVFIADTNSRKISTMVAARLNQENRKRRYLHAEALFRSFGEIAGPKEPPISTVLISFNRDGGVQLANLDRGRWMAKRNFLNHLVLIDTTDPQSPPYYLADFDQGIAGEMAFSPAVCDDLDERRYADGWEPDGTYGEFGCREWTAQLYDTDRPYINVTTYSPDGDYVGEMVGWSRFTDPPKPVIGKQGKTWLCLHECPTGESPGIIRDIRKWTAKHGFPMPQRPRKQPEYPNSDFKDSWQE